MEKEQWRSVNGFESLYVVSDKGRVKSLNYRNTGLPGLMIGGVNNWGYRSLSLPGGVRIGVHVIVAKAFIDNPEGKTDVNHKDGNKLNNCVDNLEWCTKSENIRHAYDNNLNRHKGENHFNYKPILCLQTGIFYHNSRDAAQAISINRHTLLAMLRGDIRNKTSLIHV